MAGPISGLGPQQQIPLANTFDPGQSQNQQARQTEAPVQENLVQVQGSQPSGVQNTETGNQNDVLRSQNEENSNALASSNESAGDSETERGSLIDVTV